MKIRTGNESLKNDLNFRIKTETVMVGANAMIYTVKVWFLGQIYKKIKVIRVQ